jgi:hypothetical protein
MEHIFFALAGAFVGLFGLPWNYAVKFIRNSGQKHNFCHFSKRFKHKRSVVGDFAEFTRRFRAIWHLFNTFAGTDTRNLAHITALHFVRD